MNSRNIERRNYQERNRNYQRRDDRNYSDNRRNRSSTISTPTFGNKRSRSPDDYRNNKAPRRYYERSYDDTNLRRNNNFTRYGENNSGIKKPQQSKPEVDKRVDKKDKNDKPKEKVSPLDAIMFFIGDFEDAGMTHGKAHDIFEGLKNLKLKGYNIKPIMCYW